MEEAQGGAATSAPETLDTTNYFFVTSHGGNVLVGLPPVEPMTCEEARFFAAWLVAMADTLERQDGPTFEEALNAVRDC